MNKGENTDLYLYFSLDSDLPELALLKIDFPTGFSHVPTSCNVWVIETDLKYPTIVSKIIYGTVVGTNNVYYCTFTSDGTTAVKLSKNTAYGMSLVGTSVVIEGAYAPVSLSTRWG